MFLMVCWYPCPYAWTLVQVPKPSASFQHVQSDNENPLAALWSRFSAGPLLLFYAPKLRPTPTTTDKGSGYCKKHAHEYADEQVSDSSRCASLGQGLGGVQGPKPAAKARAFGHHRGPSRGSKSRLGLGAGLVGLSVHAD